MKYNNKGISPLIATVLIIGFTIALGAMVITWGTDFFRTTTQNVDKERQNAMLCTNELDFQLQVDCNNGKVFIDNRGQVDILQVKLRKTAKADGSVEVTDEASGVPAFGKTGFDVANLGDLNKVEAIATVKANDGTNVVCSNARRELAVSC